jgi:hypothetical protein
VTRYNGFYPGSSRSSSWKLKASAIAAVAVASVGGGVALVSQHATAHDTAFQDRIGLSGNGDGSMLESAITGLSQHGASSFMRSRSLQELSSLHGFGAQFNFREQHRSTMLSFERGQIVLITHHFLLIRGVYGGLKIWRLSGNTDVEDVAPTATTQAVVPSTVPMLTTATATQAVTGGTSVTSMLTSMAPVQPAATTVSVTTGGTTVTVTVTSSATVAKMATVTTPTSTTTVPTAALTWHGLAAGDIVFVAGVKHGHVREAQLVLIESVAPTTPPVTPTVTPTITPTITPTVTPTVTPTITPTVTPTVSAAPTASPSASPKHW